MGRALATHPKVRELAGVLVHSAVLDAHRFLADRAAKDKRATSPIAATRGAAWRSRSTTSPRRGEARVGEPLKIKRRSDRREDRARLQVVPSQSPGQSRGRSWSLVQRWLVRVHVGVRGEGREPRDASSPPRRSMALWPLEYDAAPTASHSLERRRTSAPTKPPPMTAATLSGARREHTVEVHEVISRAQRIERPTRRTKGDGPSNRWRAPRACPQ